MVDGGPELLRMPNRLPIAAGQAMVGALGGVEILPGGVAAEELAGRAIGVQHVAAIEISHDALKNHGHFAPLLGRSRYCDVSRLYDGNFCTLWLIRAGTKWRDR